MLPESINWHLTYECNYGCKFCYFGQSNRLYRMAPSPIHMNISEKDAYRLLNMLKESGIRRINFAGGEPTIVQELPKIISLVHALEIEVTLVTNSTGITEHFLLETNGMISSIKLSVDSSSEEIERELGRGYGLHVRNTLRAATLIRKYGIKVMANTVVTSLNHMEDFHGLMSIIKPDRWKAFQVLSIHGENDRYYSALKITPKQFSKFVERHSDIKCMIPEDNEQMTDSYAMIDPEGRFFQNSGGRYRKSNPITKVGVAEAFSELSFDFAKYSKRETNRGSNLG